MSANRREEAVKRVFVEALAPGSSIASIFQVRDKEVRQKKAGGDFLLLTLGDRTGTVRALSFQDVDGNWDEIGQGDFIQVLATVKEYNGRPQLAISRLQPVDERELAQEDYLPSAPRDVEEMFAELLGLVASIGDPHLRSLLDDLFGDPQIALPFRSAPAAKVMHHACIGGLLAHTLSLAGLCQKAAEHYGAAAVNRDLLLAGALLHDLGKAFELDWRRGFDYTDSGRLLGHIVQELSLVERRIDRHPGFPDELKLQLLHILLSHHGTYEFGSPRRPKTVEALLLHYLDDMDSKCEAMLSLLEAEAGHPGAWTSYNKNLDRYFYKRKYRAAASAEVAASPDAEDAGLPPTGQPPAVPAPSPGRQRHKATEVYGEAAEKGEASAAGEGEAASPQKGLFEE